MKKNIPMTKMNIFAFVFVVLLTAGIIALVMNFSLTIKDEPVEEVVIDKNIKKGLYLYPRFEAITKKYEKPIKISKERYETLEIGDKINGYQKSSNEMIVEEGIRFELSIGILAIIFFLAVTIFFGSSLFSNTLFFRSRPSLKEWMQKSGVICIYVFTVMYIAVGFMFTFLTAKNLFHKYNTSQLVETEGLRQVFMGVF